MVDALGLLVALWDWGRLLVALCDWGHLQLPAAISAVDAAKKGGKLGGNSAQTEGGLGAVQALSREWLGQ